MSTLEDAAVIHMCVPKDLQGQSRQAECLWSVPHRDASSVPHSTVPCYATGADSDGCASAVRQVVCTIHQPNSDITDRFDDLLLLAGGRFVYFGAWKDAVEHFAQLGYP